MVVLKVHLSCLLKSKKPLLLVAFLLSHLKKRSLFSNKLSKE
ncbi:hypothetical protein J660_0409 [Acinetobacter sp. 88816]|nr:hypothetical protein J594_1009 [Acinetobacter sp. 259052]EXS47957.1 hypothetical protein J660_0409 [Acinetobacter sp. 88816]